MTFARVSKWQSCLVLDKLRLAAEIVQRKALASSKKTVVSHINDDEHGHDHVRNGSIPTMGEWQRT